MDQPPLHRSPPRFVPTLTEVVQLGPVPAEAAPPSPAPAATPAAAVPAPSVARVLGADDDLGEGIVHRVMQRVDASLASGLHMALTDLVATHTQLLLPLLHDEIERVVRQTVNDALSLELGPRKA